MLDFEAAHRNLRGTSAQQRLHGHSYRVELLASGLPDAEVGWVVDFAELKRLFRPLYERLDHANLNELPGLEQDSTLPALEQWMLGQLSPLPVWFDGLRVSIIGDLAYAPLRLPAQPRSGLPARIRFTFEAAQSLPCLPAGHHCRNIHGHSYRMEVGAPDLERLEDALHLLYQAFDHQYLNELPGLESATCERICAWVWEWLEQRGQRPSVVVVQETDSARCLYFGENQV